MAAVLSCANQFEPVAPSPIGQKACVGSPDFVGPAQVYETDVLSEMGAREEPNEGMADTLLAAPIAVEDDELESVMGKEPPKKTEREEPDPAGSIELTVAVELSAKPPNGKADHACEL